MTVAFIAAADFFISITSAPKQGAVQLRPAVVAAWVRTANLRGAFAPQLLTKLR